jgi:hypothetical protein
VRLQLSPGLEPILLATRGSANLFGADFMIEIEAIAAV